MLRQLGAAPLARGRFAVTPSTQAIRTLSCSSPARADDATTPSPAAGDSAAPTEPAQPKLLFRKIYTKERRADQKADKKADEETDKLAAAQREFDIQLKRLQNDRAQLKKSNNRLRKDKGALRLDIVNMKKAFKGVPPTASAQRDGQLLELYDKIAKEAREFKAGTPQSVEVVNDQQQLVITFAQPDGTTKQVAMSLHWLRDTCKCPHCVNPDSGQKNFSSTSLPETLEVQSAEINAADGSITIIWANDAVSANAASEATTHTSTYDAPDVFTWQLPYDLAGNLLPVERTLWDRSKLQAHIDSGDLRVSYNDWLTSDAAFWKAFESLARFGILFVHSIPSDRALVESQVEKIANRIGILMHTFYGFTWDVRSKPRAENVAYTNVFLGLHQDLMYIDPPPRLQLLHCISNSFQGGESLFSDGARAAYSLELNNPLAFDQLRGNRSPQFHYHRNGNDYHMGRNTFRYAGRTGEGKGFLSRIHWAPPFQAPFGRQTGATATNVLGNRVIQDGGGGAYAENEHAVVVEEKGKNMTKWVPAAKEFEREISAEENMFELKMKEGECVIFDNWRVLHGRREFQTEGQAEGAERWLKGTYISHQVYKAMENKLQWRLAQKEGGIPLAIGVAEAHGLGWRERGQLPKKEASKETTAPVQAEKTPMVEDAPKVEEAPKIEEAPKVEEAVKPEAAQSEGPSRQPKEQLGTVNWNA
ncbi:gamma-butyrobetaine dioxygenase [Neurospora intermedia]|uniref:Gamma-butyrobetaine dioxygenase n=1 Tax=Neurospora intermedia TaxID=5142 RepID=A0ABR3D9L3_NEUIN